jgi:hypothetical protein
MALFRKSKLIEIIKMSGSAQIQLPKTPLAEIYSHPYGVVNGVEHNAIEKILPYKSGLTSVSISPNATPAELQLRDDLNNYQRLRFGGLFYQSDSEVNC